MVKGVAGGGGLAVGTTGGTAVTRGIAGGQGICYWDAGLGTQGW